MYRGFAAVSPSLRRRSVTCTSMTRFWWSVASERDGSSPRTTRASSAFERGLRWSAHGAVDEQCSQTAILRCLRAEMPTARAPPLSKSTPEAPHIVTKTLRSAGWVTAELAAALASLVAAVGTYTADADTSRVCEAAMYSAPLATAGTAKRLTATSAAATPAVATEVFMGVTFQFYLASDGSGDQGAVELIGGAAEAVVRALSVFPV